MTVERSFSKLLVQPSIFVAAVAAAAAAVAVAVVVVEAGTATAFLVVLFVEPEVAATAMEQVLVVAERTVCQKDPFQQ